MSHQSSIACKIRSIEALKKACAAMRLTLTEAKSYRGYSQSFPCDYVIKLKDSPYEVGVIKNQDGTYDLKTDFWAGKVAREIGENCGLLLQEAAAQAAIEAAQMRGVSVYRTYDYEAGEVVLELEEPEELQAQL